MRYLEKQMVLGRRASYGVDFGSDRLVLVQVGDRRLVWQKSCKAWTGRLEGFQHQPGSLVLTQGSALENKHKRLHEGGRLSTGLLERFAAEIDAWFGKPVAHLAHPRKTVVE
jgi:hypothetical protein